MTTNATTGQHLLLRSITASNGQVFEVGTINVLVGPGNAGKSELLRDLARLAGNFEPTGEERAAGEEPHPRVLQDVTFAPKLTVDRLLQGLSTISAGPSEETVALGIGPDLKTPYRRTVATDWKNILYRPVITARSVWSTSLGAIMPLRIAYLPVESHARLVQPCVATSPIRPPETLLQAFQFASPEVVARFDEAMSSFGDEARVVLDATEQVQLCLRYGATIPPRTGDAVQDAHRYQALAPFEQAGDSWKSRVALLLTFLLCQGRILLIDQPEAFLQPEQSRQLGAWISTNVATLGIQLFVATHDAAFLEGLFSGSADVSVLRLSRRGTSTTMELVTPDVGRILARFPLFAAQGALRCLFQTGVIVSPEETDRMIYQTVAERLSGSHNIGFLHAHSGRNLAYVARVLRRAGLPTCVVAELDLFQAESAFVELVKSLSQNAPPAPWLATRERLVGHVEGRFDEQELSASASEVEQFLDQWKQRAEQPGGAAPPPLTPGERSAKWDRLRREKLAMLPAPLRAWVEELLDDMKRIGAFVSPKGCLQGWIATTPPVADKELWFNRVAQALDRNECPAELRAFVAELVAFVRTSSTLPRPTRSDHET